MQRSEGESLKGNNAPSERVAITDLLEASLDTLGLILEAMKRIESRLEMISPKTLPGISPPRPLRPSREIRPPGDRYPIYPQQPLKPHGAYPTYGPMRGSRAT